jgi:hypothetical protein
MLSAWLEKLSREDVDNGSVQAQSQSTKMESILDKLEHLLEGQEGLRQGQGAIYRRLETTQRETVEQMLAGLHQAQLDDVKTRQELRGTLDAIRRALIHLQTEQLPALDAGVRQILDEVTEIVRADVDVRMGLELTVPLIPLLLSYKTTLDVGAGLDLRQAWENLIDLARSQGEDRID